ncbi:MAG TPA: hypothetical protein VJ777_22200, partial [Mycobacterium sp.]|nr:hypothetical protein [Mycobacterium sp.]
MGNDVSGAVKLRYAARCARCGAALPAGAEAVWDKDARQATCIECRAEVPSEPAQASAPQRAGAGTRRVICLRYAGACGMCGKTLAAGTDARWEKATNTA